MDTPKRWGFHSAQNVFAVALHSFGKAAEQGCVRDLLAELCSGGGGTFCHSFRRFFCPDRVACTEVSIHRIERRLSWRLVSFFDFPDIHERN